MRRAARQGLVIAAAGMCAPQFAVAQTVVFTQSFEGAVPPAIVPGVALPTPVQGYSGLGHAGNQFAGSFLRCPTGNTVTVNLTGLPAHTTLGVQFLFAAIDSLDGTGTFPQGDFLNVSLDGTSFFRESFANATPTQVQSYVPPPGVQLARRVDLGFSGPGGFYTDSAYDLSLDPAFQSRAHTAPNATITFLIEGPGIQALEDESWAMDNLRVVIDCAGPTITAQPSPAFACPGGAAVFTAGASGSGVTLRWQRELPPAGSNTWVDLGNGAIPGSSAVAAGADTTTLTITGADAGAGVRYCCVATNACGGRGTVPAALSVRPGGYANCDASTASPVLNVADFSCFLQRYAAQDPYANCDASTAPPVLNVADFSCFLQKYAAGCL